MSSDSNLTFPASLRFGYSDFIARCEGGPEDYSLTPNTDVSPYAGCFSIFGRQLLFSQFDSRATEAFPVRLRASLEEMRGREEVPRGKPYRQLLTFGLSALATVGRMDHDPLADLVEEQIPSDVGEELHTLGCLAGKAGSGNQAMFLAVFLLHGRDRLGLDTQAKIDEWVDLHLRHMNRFGFWGPDRGMTHLQFQNGYHQYEILEYLGVVSPRVEEAVAAVRILADPAGHFAPYPGGGGCFDYDAVFLLTPDGRIPDVPTRDLLLKTAASIIASQNNDGGFCESHFVRPRSVANLWHFARHVMLALSNPGAFSERLRYGLALQRPKHDRIHTHWSRYSRLWDESDLWDSWFRMLALARIDVALHPEHADRWGFIDYPGIGYHPSLRPLRRVD